MPESNDQNSSWNRREPQSFETEDSGTGQWEDSGTESPREWDASDFDLSLRFEDYAPLWMQKVKSFFGKDPEWSLASSVGAIAIILTVLLLLAMPDHRPMDVAADFAKPVILGSLPDSKPIDSRIEFVPPDSFLLVDFETEPLYVSFGNKHRPFSGIAAREEKPTRLELPDFNLAPEPASSLVLNVQKIRIIEREMLDPNIDAQFLVEAKSDSVELHSQLEPADRFLFDQNWKLIDLARVDLIEPQIIRPTLYHERYPGGQPSRQHLQVGQEQPFERSRLDHLTRVTAPQQEAKLNLDIRKQFPESGTANQLLTYSILVKNSGTSPAYDVHVDETLSPLASLVDFSPRGEVKENHLHWKISRLDPNEERELRVKVFLNQTGNVKTNSKIKLVSNVAASTQITALNLDVQIKGPETVTEGDIFGIDFVITNQGERNQKEVSLDLDLPAGLEHQQGRQLTLKIDQLDSKQSRTFRARVKATKTGAVSSQAILMAEGLALGEAALDQKVVKRKTERKPTPAKQVTPAPNSTPAPSAQSPSAQSPSAPAQSCPCQPITLPVFYFVP